MKHRILYKNGHENCVDTRLKGSYTVSFYRKALTEALSIDEWK